MTWLKNRRAIEKMFREFDDWDAKVSEIASAGYSLVINMHIPDADLIYSTYCPEWLEYYQRSSFVMRDPVLHWGLFGDGVIRWSEIDLSEIVKGAYTDRVLQKAAEYGLRYGAVATTTSEGEANLKCYLSGARNDREFTDDELVVWQDCLRDAMSSYRDDYGLSEGEIAVMQLLASGMTQSEIADKLRLSRAGVKKRIERAREGLNAANTIHAISIAQAKGLIRT